MNADTFKLLEKWAADEFRSVNGQIEYLLHEAIVNAGRGKSKVVSKIQQKGKEAT